ncbi:MAG: hypothetical protein HQK57_13100 [Deltaproteobacteria bacterium]|nr:hypothetical protein [Deltaproteobacteria bacterium]
MAFVSLGAAAEMLGLWYEETMHWFSGQRIATLRSLPPELKAIADQNMREFAVVWYLPSRF